MEKKLLQYVAPALLWPGAIIVINKAL